jgi:uridine kinase
MAGIILIAGPSASGKTTIARAVAAALKVPCLSLDRYFIPRATAFVETANGPVRTFERPELYDGARLAMDFGAQSAGVVVEGFCLFAYPQVLAIPARRFYIDLPFPLCLVRRMARRPQRFSDRSFLLVGEQENATFVVPQQHIPGVFVLDGSLPVETLRDTVLGAVAQLAACA